MNAEPDPYIALELTPGSSQEQVKEQYRRLAKENHPDLNPHDKEGAEERLRRLNAAYATLSDPGRKALLDWRWEQEREQAAREKSSGHGARIADRPATQPHPAPSKNAGRSARKGRARKPTRPLTREERKRIRIAAASIGLAVSLTVVAAVYYEWTQPTPTNRIGIAPSLSSDLNGRTSIKTENWTPVSPDLSNLPPPMPTPPPPIDDTPIDAPPPGNSKIMVIKQKLMQRLDDAVVKVAAVAAEAQRQAAPPAEPGESTQRMQWRAQIAAESHQMLLQQDMVRLEVEGLSINQPQIPQDTQARIQRDSEELDRQYHNLLDDLRRSPR